MPQIKHLIVHQVCWQEHVAEKKTAKCNLKLKENPVDNISVDLAVKLRDLFNTTSLSAGCFNSDLEPEDGDIQRTKLYLELLLDREFKKEDFGNFCKFTSEATNQFTHQHFKGSNANEGYLVFIHYIERAENFLVILMLHNKDVYRVDEESLDISLEDALDIDALHLAARINLTSWQSEAFGTERYIQFKLGVKADKMRKFFADFVGCDSYVRGVVDTRQLVEAILETANQLKFDNEQCETLRYYAFLYLKDKRNLDEGCISLTELDRHLFPKHPDKLIQIAQEKPFKLGNEVTISPSGLGKLHRYKAIGIKGLTLTFDRDLLGENVHVNNQSQVYISGLQEEFINELKNDSPN